jgi:hypothetical protein
MMGDEQGPRKGPWVEAMEEEAKLSKRRSTSETLVGPKTV